MSSNRHSPRLRRSVLDDLLAPPVAPAPLPSPTSAASPTPSEPTAVASQDRGLLRLTLNLTPDLIERARIVVYYTPGLTLSAFADAALRHEIARREEERGEPFPAHRGPLRTGRPVG